MASCSCHAMQLDRCCRYITPLILNLDASWDWVADATLRPVYLEARTRVPFY
jgi:hypothetical protein